MKIKTSELSGAALDWAVGRAISRDAMIGASGALYIVQGHTPVEWRPSTNWAHGGQIVESGRISVAFEPSMLYDDSARWKAMGSMSDNDHSYGPTLLVAAMRCLVSAKLGDEVEIPEALCSN